VAVLVALALKHLHLRTAHAQTLPTQNRADCQACMTTTCLWRLVAYAASDMQQNKLAVCDSDNKRAAQTKEKYEKK
jgi:hypothetical protein